MSLWAADFWAPGFWAPGFWAETFTPTPPSIETTSLPNGSEGVAYAQPVVATGTAPIAWSLDAPIPLGWSINASGVVSNALPTPGVVTLRVRATNAYDTDLQLIALTIVGVDEFEPAAPPSRRWRVTTLRNGRSAPGIRRRLDGLAWVEKAPGDVVDYGFDYQDELVAGETITASTWSVAPAGLDLAAEGVDGTIATQWTSGGTAGTIYTLENTMTTSGGRVFVRSLKVRVQANVS
jgi:hypothetical protein